MRKLIGFLFLVIGCNVQDLPVDAANQVENNDIVYEFPDNPTPPDDSCPGQYVKLYHPNFEKWVFIPGLCSRVDNYIDDDWSMPELTDKIDDNDWVDSITQEYLF